MNYKVLIYSTLFITITAVQFSAPARWGIAIHPQEKTCSGYWAGDEFKIYKLPEGWNAYYSNAHEGKVPLIKTEFGTCRFESTDGKNCCLEMGLKYVEDPGYESQITEWGKKNGVDSHSVPVWILGAGLFLILLTLNWIIRTLRK